MPNEGIIAEPTDSPEREAINERIAELVAEVLFDHLLKRGLVPPQAQDEARPGQVDSNSTQVVN